MNILKQIIGWILIILFFPLSLIFVAYFRQQKANAAYKKAKKAAQNSPSED